SHWSTSKTPSYTKSVSWQHHPSLEIQVSAMGVATPEEWMWLESAGIEMFQGDLFAKAKLNGIPSIAWPEKK
ncbi:EAL domain-containing protein, partial [Escherichia coli]